MMHDQSNIKFVKIHISVLRLMTTFKVVSGYRRFSYQAALIFLDNVDRYYRLVYLPLKLFQKWLA